MVTKLSFSLQQEAVRWQIEHLGKDWKDGEVLLSNHPEAGGSHLPDLTVITPVWVDGKAVFYVASRGHHADIGGISPGSMPPFSRSLGEEGAAVRSFKLVKEGKFQEEEISQLLLHPGPGIIGTRALRDNISDLQAQIAANRRGITLVLDLIKEYSLPVVQAYMFHVQHNAEKAVREMLIALAEEQQLQEDQVLIAEDAMDDGSTIRLSLSINKSDGSAVFDFSGTDPEVLGNTNAPKAVTISAIIYCLRCLVKKEIPLNQGCLNPIQFRIPPGSFLCPSESAAVVGGNVLTSQRVTDVILMAFQAAANSQGCMNNFTFGTSEMGYYETIAGGSGAGNGWHGASATQVHMTNTRITDPEILERRYPVILEEFSVRKDSGGRGKFRGGEGVRRRIRFREGGISVGILSERRVFSPRGLRGGGPGGRGRNLLRKADGRIVNLGGKNSLVVEAGDSIDIWTPGGGGYGPEEVSGKEEKEQKSEKRSQQ